MNNNKEMDEQQGVAGYTSGRETAIQSKSNSICISSTETGKYNITKTRFNLRSH